MTNSVTESELLVVFSCGLQGTSHLHGGTRVSELKADDCIASCIRLQPQVGQLVDPPRLPSPQHDLIRAGNRAGGRVTLKLDRGPSRSPPTGRFGEELHLVQTDVAAVCDIVHLEAIVCGWVSIVNTTFLLVPY